MTRRYVGNMEVRASARGLIHVRWAPTARSWVTSSVRALRCRQGRAYQCLRGLHACAFQQQSSATTCAICLPCTYTTESPARPSAKERCSCPFLVPSVAIPSPVHLSCISPAAGVPRSSPESAAARAHAKLHHACCADRSAGRRPRATPPEKMSLDV